MYRISHFWFFDSFRFLFKLNIQRFNAIYYNNFWHYHDDIDADIDSISFSFNYEFNYELINILISKLFEIQEKILYTYRTHGANRGKMARQRWWIQRDWIELVFWKEGERVSRDFSRFLPSRGGREWVIYRPFRILDDSGNLRYEESSVELEDRAICLVKKSAKTELDRRFS